MPFWMRSCLNAASKKIWEGKTGLLLGVGQMTRRRLRTKEH